MFVLCVCIPFLHATKEADLAGLPQSREEAESLQEDPGSGQDSESGEGAAQAKEGGCRACLRIRWLGRGLDAILFFVLCRPRPADTMSARNCRAEGGVSFMQLQLLGWLHSLAECQLAREREPPTYPVWSLLSCSMKSHSFGRTDLSWCFCGSCACPESATRA